MCFYDDPKELGIGVLSTYILVEHTNLFWKQNSGCINTYASDVSK